MKRLFGKIICVVLSLIMVFTLTSCGEKTWVLNEKLPAYYHYDKAAYLEKCDKLESYLEEGDMDKFGKLYDKLQPELLLIADMMFTAEILVDKDLTDTEIAEEMIYIENAYEEMQNRFNTICSNACRGQYSETFKAYLNDDTVFDAYVAYASKDEKVLELIAKEKELVAKYQTANNNWDAYTFEYKGRKYCYSDTGSFDYTQDKYSEIYLGISKAINKGLGEIYVELVKVRQQIASALGYDNYGDYIDKTMYGRTFSFDDLEYVREAIKQNGKKIDYLRSFAYVDQVYEMIISEEKYISDVSKGLKEVSALASDSFDKLVADGLYDMEDRENRSDGAYICTYPSVANGYLFCTKENTTLDYQYLAHEIGHYTNGLLQPEIYSTILGQYIDTLEVHSTGLQILFATKARDVITNYTDGMYGNEIASLLSTTYDGFELDEFERKVYSDPDITLDKVNQYYRETREDYGEYYCVDYDYDWYYISHLFKTPFYYLSYGVSGFAALQIYAESKDDFANAVSIWEKTVSSDSEHVRYEELVSDAGLGLYSDKNVCQNAIGEAVSDAWNLAEDMDLISSDWNK